MGLHVIASKFGVDIDQASLPCIYISTDWNLKASWKFIYDINADLFAWTFFITVYRHQIEHLTESKSQDYFAISHRSHIKCGHSCDVSMLAGDVYLPNALNCLLIIAYNIDVITWT